jgi:Spermine/spermidine synthase domain
LAEATLPAGRRALALPPLTGARRLVALSFLSLFLELALIRWTSSNIFYLGYFTNFVLLASFLGIGMGFLLARRRFDLLSLAPVCLGVYMLVARSIPVSANVPSSASLIFFQSAQAQNSVPPQVVLPFVFLGTVLSMAAVAQGLARVFLTLPALDAYRWDIVGSLAGIIAFTALSALGSPPIVWGLVVAVLMLVLLARRPSRLQFVGYICLLLTLGFESLAPMTAWSPYYKVHWAPVTLPGQGRLLSVDVNAIPHQTARTYASMLTYTPFYLKPYDILGRAPGHVLIIGAGTGNDVEAALSAGATRVDAVEIDPQIYALGRQLAPSQPYSDPRVQVHIDDGRAFIQASTDHYDLIVLALTDSLTLVSGQSALRLESYLFTEDAMRVYRAHLAPGGLFAEYNFYRQDWLVDRLGGTLQSVYGHAPCIQSYDTGAGLYGFRVLATTVDGNLTCTTWSGKAEVPATDDWPFLYVRQYGIPDFYLETLALILGCSLLALLLVGIRPWRLAGYADLFLMGIAFLLLETKNVVAFALLFGTTWLVNALVFIGVLVAILAAIEVSRRKVLPQLPLYLALLASLVVAWLIPVDNLLGLAFVPRFAAGVALGFTPVFIANLVFAQRFREAGDSPQAFAANLLGAVVGGLLEYSSLLIGYRNLLIVVGACYALALVSGRVRLPWRFAAPA